MFHNPAQIAGNDARMVLTSSKPASLMLLDSGNAAVLVILSCWHVHITKAGLHVHITKAVTWIQDQLSYKGSSKSQGVSQR
jgi:hypothetical protein